ncbi:VOC family protein [Microbacterium bovistercoris]|nr:VOC family protein [Microbacterium bovistercoris]
MLTRAERAGGSIVRPAERAQWGGYFGYLGDPDGHLWKVVSTA